MPRSLSPPARASTGAEREEVGEHVQRAVRHVDDPHEPEDEGEPARDDEVEPGEREAVEPDDHAERARVAVRLVCDPDGDECDDERDGDLEGESAGARLARRERRSSSAAAAVCPLT